MKVIMECWNMGRVERRLGIIEHLLRARTTSMCASRIGRPTTCWLSRCLIIPTLVVLLYSTPNTPALGPKTPLPMFTPYTPNPHLYSTANIAPAAPAVNNAHAVDAPSAMAIPKLF